LGGVDVTASHSLQAVAKPPKPDARGAPYGGAYCVRHEVEHLPPSPNEWLDGLDCAAVTVTWTAR